jgi:hypothetical protein
MVATLVVLGLVCIAAAIVGGDVTIMGNKIPVINSPRRQIAFGTFGTLLIGVGVSISFGLFSRTEPKPTDPIVVKPQPVNDRPEPPIKTGPPAPPREKTYKPIELIGSGNVYSLLANQMGVTVTRKDEGESFDFHVALTAPFPPGDGETQNMLSLSPVPYGLYFPAPPAPPPSQTHPYGFDLIKISDSQTTNGTPLFLPPSTLPPTRPGSWKSGDSISQDFILQKKYADPKTGWDLRLNLCSTATRYCLPSPNLLTDVPSK